MKVLRFLVLVAAVGSLYVGCGGKVPDVSQVLRPPPLVEPVDNTKPAEAAVWESLAQWVETQPQRVKDTDHLYKMAQELQRIGYVSDLSRLSGYAAKYSEVTDANRAAVAAKVRGK